MSVTTRWSRALVAGLVAAGVDRFFMSPGSRSTPLTLAVHTVAKGACTVVADERSAAFAALGHARVTGAPAALIATSGTAAGHWFPAILEAEAAHVPLVAISADRPIELQEAGASQTLDQVRLFGTHVRKSFEIGAPDEAALPRAADLAARIVAAACSPIAGPVHVNARFRKPLEPTDAPLAEIAGPVVFPAALGPSREALAFLIESIARSERPCIVAGPWPYNANSRAATLARLRTAVQRLQRSTGIAVLAESTSGLPGSLGTALEARLFSGAHAPDLLIEVGSFPVLGAYATPRPGRRIGIAPATLVDPIGGAAAHILSDPLLALEALADALEGKSAARHVAEATARLHRRLQAAKRAVAASLATSQLDGPSALSLIAAAQPASATLLSGNSLVIRDLESYGALPHEETMVLHQRGAAGIDGLIAGAYGTSLATEGPTTVVLGDVSALHDAGSFHLLSRLKEPLVVVVIDDGGGHIFDALPIHNHLGPNSDAYRELYLTPPAEGFLRGIVGTFGLGYREPEDAAMLVRDLSEALTASNATVIRVRVDAAASRARRAALQKIAEEAARAD